MESLLKLELSCKQRECLNVKTLNTMKLKCQPSLQMRSRRKDAHTARAPSRTNISCARAPKENREINELLNCLRFNPKTFRNSKIELHSDANTRVVPEDQK